MQNHSHKDAQIISNHIAQSSDQKSRDNQLCPALGNRHGRRCGGAADIGIGGNDDFFDGELEDFSENQGNNHIDRHHNQGQNQKQGRFFDDQDNGCRGTDYRKEEVNQEGTDFLRAFHGRHLLREEGGNHHGNGGNQQVFVPEETAHKLTEGVFSGEESADDSGELSGKGYDGKGNAYRKGNVL